MREDMIDRIRVYRITEEYRFQIDGSAQIVCAAYNTNVVTSH